MGFGLPSALGAAAAHDGRNGRPKRVVVDIDGDGSFLMNCQELATAAIEKLNIKVRGLGWVGLVVWWLCGCVSVRPASRSHRHVCLPHLAALPSTRPPTPSHQQVLLLNNQHLGMVVQWEDRFYKVGGWVLMLMCGLDRS
jgi:hypothetical protein